MLWKMYDNYIICIFFKICKKGGEGFIKKMNVLNIVKKFKKNLKI